MPPNALLAWLRNRALIVGALTVTGALTVSTLTADELATDELTTPQITAAEPGALSINTDGTLDIDTGEGLLNVEVGDSITLSAMGVAGTWKLQTNNGYVQQLANGGLLFTSDGEDIEFDGPVHIGSQGLFVYGAFGSDPTFAGDGGDLTIKPGNDIFIQAQDVSFQHGAVINGRLLTTWGDDSTSERGRVVVLDEAGAAYPAAAPGSTSEAALLTRPISALSLLNNATLRVTAWGIAAANTNSKIVRLRLGASGAGTGGTSMGQCTFASASDTVWRAQWLVQRSGTDTQRAFVDCNGAATKAQATTTGALDDGAVIDAVITAQNATSASDLTIYGVTIEYLP